MPDNDHIPRGVAGIWRRAARAGLSGLPSAEVGDELRLALSATVRDADLPPAGDLGRALRDSAVWRDPSIWETEADRYLQRAGRSDLAFALVNQGEAMLEGRSQELAAMPEQTVAQELAANALRRVVDARVWGPAGMLPALVSTGFESPAEARRYQESCLDAAQIPDAAEQVVRKWGSHVRAPRSTAERPTTAQMIDEEVE
jgi:hypothetical protein